MLNLCGEEIVNLFVLPLSVCEIFDKILHLVHFLFSCLYINYILNVDLKHS